MSQRDWASAASLCIQIQWFINITPVLTSLVLVPNSFLSSSMRIDHQASSSGIYVTNIFGISKLLLLLVLLADVFPVEYWIYIHWPMVCAMSMAFILIFLLKYLHQCFLIVFAFTYHFNQTSAQRLAAMDIIQYSQLSIVWLIWIDLHPLFLWRTCSSKSGRGMFILDWWWVVSAVKCNNRVLQ